MKTIRKENYEMPETFAHDMNHWALESISTIALDKRLGLIGSTWDPEVEHFIECVRNFFELGFDIEFSPSLWKYYDTPKWKKLVKAFDDITEYNEEFIKRY